MYQTIKELFLTLRVHHGWGTVVVLIGIVAAVLYGTFEAGVLVERHILSATKQPVRNEAPQKIIEQSEKILR
jgi:hypothetical protein